MTAPSPSGRWRNTNALTKRTLVLEALPPQFYAKPVLQVAPSLIGKLLVRSSGSQTLVGRIVEVEAYRQDDPASHSYRGETDRNGVMFLPGGHLYVYFTYGMHFCANVVTGDEGTGEATLIRAVEPLWGIGAMAKRRYGKSRVETRKELIELTNGPAKLCESFGLGRKDNGLSLQGPQVFISEGIDTNGTILGVSERVGISVAKEKKWRWFLPGNAWVSK